MGDFMMCLVCNCSGDFSSTIYKDFGNFTDLRWIGEIWMCFMHVKALIKLCYRRLSTLPRFRFIHLCLCCYLYAYISAFVCFVRIINEFVNLFYIPTKCGFVDLVITPIEWLLLAGWWLCSTVLIDLWHSWAKFSTTKYSNTPRKSKGYSI